MPPDESPAGRNRCAQHVRPTHHHRCRRRRCHRLFLPAHRPWLRALAPAEPKRQVIFGRGTHRLPFGCELLRARWSAGDKTSDQLAGWLVDWSAVACASCMRCRPLHTETHRPVDVTKGVRGATRKRWWHHALLGCCLLLERHGKARESLLAEAVAAER
jgi:hypothetical protein